MIQSQILDSAKKLTLYLKNNIELKIYPTN